MTGTQQTPSLDQIQVYLAIAAALASLGLLPRSWQKTLGTTASLIWIVRHLR